MNDVLNPRKRDPLSGVPITPDPRPLVHVRWLDARGVTYDWRSSEDTADGPCECQSVGWLIHRDTTHIVVAPHQADEDDPESQEWCGAMYIPLGSILSVTRIFLPTKD